MRRTTSKPPPSRPPATPPAQANRYVCVHGHFYQPPRENPWLETVEVQDSAAPYHDWNDRITAECYAPNGASRITNLQSQIVRIVNNYARMSFNFGPTLLSWLQEKAPRTYRMILDADKVSASRYGGHGSALAQVYNHIIMPLASTRDAQTQIRWGIADFIHRFGRRPEGMWLAETAVSKHVLDLLAREGILFTVLAPNQCARVRGIARESGNWTETPNASVDPTQPYWVDLDDGRSIAVFFYAGPESRAIAFERLLDSGEKFAGRLMAAFRAENHRPQLSHVATDGESYGHHHKHGEMALSFAMHWVEEQGLATLTNYGEFLAKFPPTCEAMVVENSSWSCAHGVERWRANCGCNGGKPGFNQEWRGPLREALDLLRDQTAPLAEACAEGLLIDLWAARDAYIDVVLDRSPASVDRFLATHATRELTEAERITVFELLELERHTQLMYTSCGWFFDDISGIETVQIIVYAGRVLQLSAKLFGEVGAALEPAFLHILERAKSNVPEFQDGAQVYKRFVSGMRIGLQQVGAHYAISSVFRNYPEDGELFCFDLHRDSHEVFTSGRGKVALGRARIRSRVTEESESICFAVLHLGDQNLSAAVKPFDQQDLEAFQRFSGDVRKAIAKANLPEIIRLIDRFFQPDPPPGRDADRRRGTDRRDQTAHISLDPIQPQPGQTAGEPGAVQPGIAHTLIAPPAQEAPPTAYSLTSLFADEQHRILRTILNQTIGEMEDSLRKIYEDHASLLHFLTESGVTPPPALALAASFALNASLRRAIEADPFDGQEVVDLIARAVIDRVTLDTPILAFAAGQRMKRAMIRLEAAVPEPGDNNFGIALQCALGVANCILTMPFEVTIWQAQNIWNDLLNRSDAAQWLPEWREAFKRLGQTMNIAVDQLVVEEGVGTF